MPDGSNIRSKFAASDTLASVREFIKQTLASTSSIAAFEIVQVHPSRFFSISDEERSLKDLDLLPSASLLVKFSLSQSSAYPASSSGIVSTLLTPFQILFSWISLLFIWLSSQLRARTPSSQQRATLTGDHPQQQSASNTVNDARAAAEKRNESRFKSMADLNREKEEKAAGKDSKKESSYNGNSTAQDF
ncbi:hypothetical protein BDR26DRAFT_59441 [Obelidium mucronatum]|nr:hypothetical protein BDR26DRAFT_59441 [Obelidium mucronatum]